MADFDIRLYFRK